MRRALRPVEMLGLFHARKLRVHELAIRSAGWDTSTSALGLTKPLLRLVHAGASRAATSRSRPRRRTLDGARWTSWRCAARERATRPGELAIVLHTHMPYVEGFGTWPFGEEWLWEAMATCYLPLLDLLERRGAASRLGHAGARRPARGAGRRRSASWRSCARCAVATHRSTSTGCRASGERRPGRRDRALVGRTTRARRALRGARRRPARARSRRTRRGRRRRRTRCCRCWPPTPACALQVAAGIDAHRARFGHRWGGGFWLPECAHAPWLDPLLEEAGVHATCVDLTDVFGPGDARHLRPLRTRGRPAAGPGRPRDDRAGVERRRLPRPRRPTATTTTTRSTTTGRGPTTAASTTATAALALAREHAARLRRAPSPARAARRLGGGWRCARWTPSCSATGGTRACSGWRRCSRRPAARAWRSSASTTRSTRHDAAPAPSGLPVDHLGRAARPVDLGRTGGRRPGLAARAAELRVVAAGCRGAGDRGGARAAGAAVQRLGVHGLPATSPAPTRASAPAATRGARRGARP